MQDDSFTQISPKEYIEGVLYPYKICDPVHGFIRFGPEERLLIDARPFQRLRYIRQMGVAYLIYPGATHTRFEHSLGVMELATRIYNTITAPHNQAAGAPQLSSEEIAYWRLILRLAALCHDLGHLPFSHTAEKSLLPGKGHEGMTLKILESNALAPLWKALPGGAEEDVIRLSLSHREEGATPWQRALSQVITEDNFGADRIDYLIRDGHFTGVGYGHFDYHQLIDSLRILSHQGQLSLGVTASGLQSVESLWIARYMMYARVYHLPKCRQYSEHMHRFMRRYYQESCPHAVEAFLDFTDFEVLTRLSEAARANDPDALVLLKRKPLETLFVAPEGEGKLPCRQFWVLQEKGGMIASTDASSFLKAIPVSL